MIACKTARLLVFAFFHWSTQRGCTITHSLLLLLRGCITTQSLDQLSPHPSNPSNHLDFLFMSSHPSCPPHLTHLAGMQPRSSAADSFHRSDGCFIHRANRSKTGVDGHVSVVCENNPHYHRRRSESTTALKLACNRTALHYNHREGNLGVKAYIE